MSTRRDFLKVSTIAAGAVALGGLPAVHAAGGDDIKIGVIGCGGRGTGAADNCLTAVTQNVRITALGDVFQDRLQGCRNHLKKFGDRGTVQDNHCFVGLNAYQDVINSGVDLVILATPPGFRPIHIAAAVTAGKHIFTEKPVGVDGPGLRKVFAAYEEAKKKNLGIVAGTQRRHQTGYLETIKRLHDGAIGDIVSGRCYWNQGKLWHRDKGDLKDLEWQIRNWLYFVWLSGDHICEQHVHNLDVMNWVLKGHPERCAGMGGRQVRTGPEFGHIFDHFAIEYVYPGDVHVFSQCRQIEGCKNDVSEAVVGTRGSAQVNAYRIKAQEAWNFGQADNKPYEQEHADLIASIRAGKPLNELKQVAESTLTAVMGRMAAYSGKEIKWEDALNSQESTMPEKLSWDMSLPVPPVAVPGKTKLS
jgi:predicted dehydrogenase